MKIGIKQGIVIGGLALAVGGFLLKGAWADTATPQPVPLANQTDQSLTVNPPTGTGDSIANPQAYSYPQTYAGPYNDGATPVPQGTPGYGGYGGYWMGGYGGYGGMMGGYGGGSYGGMM